jgi:hypothetical protein
MYGRGRLTAPPQMSVFLISGGVFLRQAVDQAGTVVTGCIGVLRGCLVGVVVLAPGYLGGTVDGTRWVGAGLDQVAFLPALMTDFL